MGRLSTQYCCSMARRQYNACAIYVNIPAVIARYASYARSERLRAATIARPMPALPKARQRAAAPASHLLPARRRSCAQAQDLLFFAYRDFTGAADRLLEELGLGRAHHRALHFIGRNPGMTVGDLLAILRITKQSLARVLTSLVEKGFVAQPRGRSDRRQRLLTLTEEGQALERRLFERQRERLAAAYRDAGAPAVEGFRRVMRGIMDEDARAFSTAPS